MPHNVLNVRVKKSDKDKVPIENVRDKFYERYNAELGQLWQHSIMAWSFELLIFTGYGYLIANFFLKCSERHVTYNELNLVALSLCFIGLCVSSIWIALVKAAKTRQESFEEIICNLERDPDYFPYSRIYAMGGFHNRIKGLDTKLSTTNPGKFSPSRLNMFIGQFTWLIWASLSFVHVYLPNISLLCRTIEVVFYLGLYALFRLILLRKCENSYFVAESYGRDYITQRFELILKVSDKLQNEIIRKNEKDNGAKFRSFMLNEISSVVWLFDGSPYEDELTTALWEKYKVYEEELITGQLTVTASMIGEVDRLLSELKQKMSELYKEAKEYD